MKRTAGPWPIKKMGFLLNSKAWFAVTLDERDYWEFKRLSEKYGGQSPFMRYLIRKELKKL